MSEIRLFDNQGRRNYLSAEERERFLAASRQARPELRTLCDTLVFTGARVSEALELTPARIDMSGQRVIIRSLKKRKDKLGNQMIEHRAVPVPPALLDTLQAAHGIRQAQKRGGAKAAARIWPWTRQHAAVLIKGVMPAAQILEGLHRKAHGLRHAYGVHAIGAGVPLNLLQKWGMRTSPPRRSTPMPSARRSRPSRKRMWA
ncbi:tyrosine-type recombinase/integrase [Paralimibaculum aggregatum]|uniref:tyrosine-type recombinase/integrase n=1 Tax=Paralimibaculum aggregatum TaxID=3036245 RepID=UPI00255258BD|nr:tyrosine-type recombinase/integrase [Limibaculum sp. NKW23]